MIKISIGEMNETLKELILGILIYGAVLEIVAFFANENKMAGCLGALMGIIVAIICVIHMYDRLDTALDMDTKSATKYIRAGVGFRWIIMAAVLVLGFRFMHVLNPFFIVLGVLGLKCSAYIHPITHKYIFNKVIKKRR